MAFRSPARHFLSVALFCAIATDASAEVRLGNLFTEGMVLQRGTHTPIWGTARDGETITVRLQNQQVSTTAKDGKWRVELGNLSAGGPFELVVTGTNTIRVGDVLVGDVWLCAGETNMEMPLLASLNGSDTAADARSSRMRLFGVGKMPSGVPRSELDGRWERVTPETAGDFSAVGYLFGRELQRSIDVPIGLIQATWSGTPAHAWMSTRAVERDPQLRPLLERQKQDLQTFVASLDTLLEDLKQYRDAVAKAIAEGRDGPALPSFQPFLNPALRPGAPANLFNGMIAPLAPFAVRGVLLYQGESNVPRYREYAKVLAALIDDWRQAWAQPDLPFVIVQLAPYGRREAAPHDSRWAEVRHAQLSTATTMASTGLVVISDAGTPGTASPPDKEPVGVRAALAARAVAYREPIVGSGPLYKNMRIDGNKVVLEFDHVGGGLVAKSDRLTGFAIAGADGRFVPALAQIQGQTVTVWSPSVRAPAAVRYAWADFPDGNLMNKQGLPASPFRTQ